MKLEYSPQSIKNSFCKQRDKERIITANIKTYKIPYYFNDECHFCGNQNLFIFVAHLGFIPYCVFGG